MSRNAARRWRGRIRILRNGMLVADTHPDMPDTAAPLDDTVTAVGLGAMVALIGDVAGQFHGQQVADLSPTALARRVATLRTYLAKPGGGGRATLRVPYEGPQGQRFVAYLDTERSE